MRVRLMRMIPPWHMYRSAACCMPHKLAGAAELYVSYCQYLAFMHQGKPLVRIFQILKFPWQSCLKYLNNSVREFHLPDAMQGSVKFASGYQEGAERGFRHGRSAIKMPEKCTLVR